MTIPTDPKSGKRLTFDEMVERGMVKPANPEGYRKWKQSKKNDPSAVA